MKKENEYKSFIICDLIVIIIKFLAGFFGHSLTLLSTIIYDIIAIITSLIALKAQPESSKGKAVFSSLYAFIIILLSIGMTYFSFQLKPWKPSLLILIFLLICIVSNYVITVYKTNTSYVKKEGMLGYGNKNSNINIILYILVLGTTIISKFTGLWKYFKYVDRIGVVLVSLLLIYYALRILLRSFKKMEDMEEKITQTLNEEINKCKEVKNVTKVGINHLGGIKRIDIELKLQEALALPDLITFVVTLEDFLLKYSDLSSVKLVKNANRKVVRRIAGNSGSTNSKGSTKKKNTKKKNKKR